MEKDFHEARREIYERKGWELPSNPQPVAHSERRVELLKLYLELDMNEEE